MSGVGESYSSYNLDYFHREFRKETDRACVILAAAMLEQTLETLLRAYLVPVGGADDSLFGGPNAPLASFSSKIDMSHRIGLISVKMCRDLHLIRRIRNDFAHNVTGCSFESSSVRNRICEITRSSGIIERNPTWHGDVKTPRDEFGVAVSWMLWYLTEVTERTKNLEPHDPEFGYTATFKEKEVKDTPKSITED
jgi:hypothetical protein